MDLLAHLPALQVIVPMLSAPLIVLLQPRGLAWAGATAAGLASFAIAVALTIAVLDGRTQEYSMGGWPAPYGIALAVDQFSALMLLVVTGAGAAALLAARPSVNQQIEPDRQPLFYSAWLLALAGLTGIVVSADAFNIFVFMEISSLASYVLIAGGPDRRALPAVFKYLIMGTIGATFYLIGVGLIYMMTGTLNLADMALRLADVTALNPVLVAAGFITIGLALKAAVFPLHVWLPNAYTQAPHLVTVFLAACATKVAIYILIRFDYMVFQGTLAGHDAQFALLLPLAILGILVASAVAMFEGHLKRLLASSSVAQIGYIILGASFVSESGLAASVMHVFNHALAKGGLFLAVAGIAYHYRDLRLEQLAGAATRMPLTCAALVACGFSLIGIPGTAGFISKWLLIRAALETGPLGWLLVAVILISSLMAVVYIWRIVEALYFNKASVDSEAAISEAPAQLLLVTWLVALLNIGFGLFPALPLKLANASAALLMGYSG